MVELLLRRAGLLRASALYVSVCLHMRNGDLALCVPGCTTRRVTGFVTCFSESRRMPLCTRRVGQSSTHPVSRWHTSLLSCTLAVLFNPFS
jgi:hypothetical protein